MLRTTVHTLALALSLSLLSGCQADPGPAGGPPAPRATAIANGSDSLLPGTEFVARIEHNSAMTCSGSLIHPRLLLTAAHCVVPTGVGASCNPDAPVTTWHGRSVVLGQQTIAVAANGLLPHPSYRSCEVAPPAGYRMFSVIPNDVALVVLATPVTDVPLGRLAVSVPVPGDRTTILGYGVTENDRERNNPDWGTKRWAEAFVCTGAVSGHDGFEMCAKPSEIDPAWPTERSGLMCIGDSGGPTLDATGAITGVHSTTACRRPLDQRPAGWPFVDAAVAHASNRDWIDGVVARAGADRPWVCAQGRQVGGGACAADDCRPGERCGTATTAPCACGEATIAAGSTCACGFALCEATDGARYPLGACHEGHLCVGAMQTYEGHTCSGCWNGWVPSEACGLGTQPQPAPGDPQQPPAPDPNPVPPANGLTCVNPAQSCPAGLMRSPACQALTTNGGSPCCAAGQQPCVRQGSCRPCPGY